MGLGIGRRANAVRMEPGERVMMWGGGGIGASTLSNSQGNEFGVTSLATGKEADGRKNETRGERDLRDLGASSRTLVGW